MDLSGSFNLRPVQAAPGPARSGSAVPALLRGIILRLDGGDIGPVADLLGLLPAGGFPVRVLVLVRRVLGIAIGAAGLALAHAVGTVRPVRGAGRGTRILPLRGVWEIYAGGGGMFPWALVARSSTVCEGIFE